MNRNERARIDLIRLDTEDQIDLDFVRREAGELPMSVTAEQAHDLLRDERGDRYYSDLLFVLTHARFAPDEARDIWRKVIAHERVLSRTLRRDVGVVVAAIDFLSNVNDTLERPVCVEADLLSAAADLATRDALTGLYDHSTFQLTLRRELERCDRYETSLSIAIFDVDHFKAYNDTHGHPAGDRVLEAIARTATHTLREVDTVCRYGGEEFAIVAPQTAAERCVALADRLRRSVHQATGVSVSVGVASYPEHGDTPAKLISAADAALYRAKQDGRDRVALASSSSL